MEPSSLSSFGIRLTHSIRVANRLVENVEEKARSLVDGGPRLVARVLGGDSESTPSFGSFASTDDVLYARFTMAMAHGSDCGWDVVWCG